MLKKLMVLNLILLSPCIIAGPKVNLGKNFEAQKFTVPFPDLAPERLSLPILDKDKHRCSHHTPIEYCLVLSSHNPDPKSIRNVSDFQEPDDGAAGKESVSK